MSKLTPIEMHDALRMLLADIEEGIAALEFAPGQKPPAYGDYSWIDYVSGVWALRVTQRGGSWCYLDEVSHNDVKLEWDDMPPDLQNYRPHRADQTTQWGWCAEPSGCLGRDTDTYAGAFTLYRQGFWQ